ncbi:hypothetical protein [Xanthomonas translucens]|uniref:hypothetical protein n=1 Tax=Xanthomonas campestris pv. translucens TaxID=343 RepID=UPI0012D936BD|nr:hypothetical protein [Xanthomonas translucens]
MPARLPAMPRSRTPAACAQVHPDHSWRTQMKSARAVSSFRSSHAVTIAVPVGVGNDIEKPNKVTREILGRLGCAG